MYKEETEISKKSIQKYYRMEMVQLLEKFHFKRGLLKRNLFTRKTLNGEDIISIYSLKDENHWNWKSETEVGYSTYVSGVGYKSLAIFLMDNYSGYDC